jgi:hypothetical protein
VRSVARSPSFTLLAISSAPVELDEHGHAPLDVVRQIVEREVDYRADADAAELYGRFLIQAADAVLEEQKIRQAWIQSDLLRHLFTCVERENRTVFRWLRRDTGIVSIKCNATRNERFERAGCKTDAG